MTAFAYEALIHDLHTPVASLQSLAKTLEATESTDQVKKEATALVIQLAGQILMQVSTDKAHLGIGQATLQRQDVLPLIEDAIRDTFHASQGHQQKKIKKNLPAGPVLVSCDVLMMRRALTNLMHNALDAAQSQIEISVLTEGPETRITVSDDGPGLSYADVSLYLQGKKKSSKGDRPAYGLAATQHIIRSHGGKLVYLPSTLGGAAFEITLANGRT